ncbi:MAG: T9SS type A sorting domain-containing protein [Bacteroidia bacterium]
MKTSIKNRLYQTNRKMTFLSLFMISIFTVLNPKTIFSQPILFDFDNAPPYTSLPISQTVAGLTAQFNATGSGFSIQAANVLGFTPAGFSGMVIYPNSVFQADLLINFNQPVTDFSIMYACQELGCDDAALMRVTAYMSGNYVGTDTKTATFPGTWPTDTLRCSFPTGFDSVVVHYDSPPPTCQDYGVIFMADNMVATPLVTSVFDNTLILHSINLSANPVTSLSILSFTLAQSSNVSVRINDIQGRIVKEIFNGRLAAGIQNMTIDVSGSEFTLGIYIISINTEYGNKTHPLTVVR